MIDSGRVIPRQAVPPELARLAHFQGGVVSREQVFGLGVGRHVLGRLLSTGVWLRIAPGIYHLKPVQPDWEGSVWAGVLTGGEGTRVAGLAAARLHRLIDADPELVNLLVPAGRWVPVAQPSGPIRWQFNREGSAVRLARSVGSPPRLTVEDTVLDLASTGPSTEVASWISTAVQRRATTTSRLRRALDGRPAIARRRELTELLADVAVGAESPLELRYLRDVERAHGLPSADRQVRAGTGIVDALYQDFGLLVELDGRLGHTGSGRFRDLERDNAATTIGLATLRYGWRDVTGCPCLVAAQVVRNLVLRGWSGSPHQCRQCPPAGSDRNNAA